MPLSNYIGQYGESLRRLTALGNAQPQQMGQADVSGAGALQGPMPPGALPQSPSDAGPSAPVPAGALSGPQPGGAPPQDTGSPTDGRIGLSHLLSASTTGDKEHMVQQLESKGVDINKQFDELKSQGYVPDVGKMSRHDKGALLTEFGLRMMAASAQGGDAFQAAGVAGQGLLESIRAKQDSDEKEATRKTERQQTISDEKAEKAAERASRTSDVNAEIAGRKNVAEGESAGRKDVANIEAKARLLAAKMEAKRSNKPMQYVDDKGNVKLVTAKDDGTYEVTTPQEDVVTTQTRPGKGRNAMPEQVEIHTPTPITSAKKQTSANTLTPGEIETAIGKEKERLGKDLTLGSALRNAGLTGEAKDKELERMARERVMGRQTQSGGDDGNDPAQVRGD